MIDSAANRSSRLAGANSYATGIPLNVESATLGDSQIKQIQTNDMMALGALLYGVSYGMYGITSTYPMFAVAMIVITIAEMITDPIQQSLVASFAPEDMRGRYMAASTLSWQVAYGGGPYLAGLLLDSTNPNMLWAACAALGGLRRLDLQSWIRFIVPRLFQQPFNLLWRIDKRPCANMEWQVDKREEGRRKITNFR